MTDICANVPIHVLNHFASSLPGDTGDINMPRQVFEACYSPVEPTPVSSPSLVSLWPEVAELLDFDRELTESDFFVDWMAGNVTAESAIPYAMCYGGHQFGHWAGQLGDGRAINIGEVQGKDGELWTLQLKGAGPTPYSRTADGRAVLRSSVREFLCSEAMHHLGIPTTRALSLIVTGDKVVRDMFYDGRPEAEPGAIVCRVARSFLRLGNYEIFASREDPQTLKTLLDYTLKTHFPHLGEPDPKAYVAWFEEVGKSTVDLIIHWMRVGFVHGVMNTDNLSILGLTIDYGPYGWLDDYDPNWTPNTTDAETRRYRFAAQPGVALWNLGKLGSAIATLCDVEPLQAVMDAMSDRMEKGWFAMMGSKIGIAELSRPNDDALINDLQKLLTSRETDMTLFFRALATVETVEHARSALAPAFYDDGADDYWSIADDWLERWLQRVSDLSVAERENAMNRVNPKYVLRNYLAQLAIDDAHKGDYGMLRRLMEVLRKPYDEQPENDEFAAKRPDWARSKPGCSMLSCSS